MMASALEALTNLSLQLEVRAEIQPILIKALNKVQPEFLPTILKFLFTDCDAPLMDEVSRGFHCKDLATNISGNTNRYIVLLKLGFKLLKLFYSYNNYCNCAVVFFTSI